MRYLIPLALFASPALAQEVPTTTARSYSTESMATCANAFRSAWQQQTGNPYYDTFDAEPKNGVPDSIEAIFAVQACARMVEYGKANAPVTKPDPAALAAERAKALGDARAALAGVR